MTDVPPPQATARTFGEYSLDPLEAFLLDVTHPDQDTARGAWAFQILEAQEMARQVRSAVSEGRLDLAVLGGEECVVVPSREMENLEVSVNGAGEDPAGSTSEILDAADRLVEAWLSMRGL